MGIVKQLLKKKNRSILIAAIVALFFAAIVWKRVQVLELINGKVEAEGFRGEKAIVRHMKDAAKLLK